MELLLDLLRYVCYTYLDFIMFLAKNLDCIILLCVLFSSYLILRVFKNVLVGGFLTSWFLARQLDNSFSFM